MLMRSTSASIGFACSHVLNLQLNIDRSYINKHNNLLIGILQPVYSHQHLHKNEMSCEPLRLLPYPEESSEALPGQWKKKNVNSKLSNDVMSLNECIFRFC